MGYITKICPGLTHHLTILRQIVVGNGAAGCRNCFAVTDTGNIIGVTDTGTTLGAAGGLGLRHHCVMCSIGIKWGLPLERDARLSAFYVCNRLKRK